MDNFAAFDVDAAELMLNKGVKASELHKRLREITIAASDGLPRLRVLYCRSYGGYSYSAGFRTFCRQNKAKPDSLAAITCGLRFAAYRSDKARDKDDNLRFVSDRSDEARDKDDDEDTNESQFRHDSEDDDDNDDDDEEKDESEDKGKKRNADEAEEFENEMDYVNKEKEHRVRDVKRVIQYGEHVLEKWPLIAKLVKAYVRNDLGDRMDDIESMEAHGERLTRLQNLSAKLSLSIATEKGKSEGATKWRKYFYSYDIEDFSSYAPSALEAMRRVLDKELNRLTRDIERRHDELLKHMPETQYQAMLQSRSTKLPEEVEAEDAEERERQLEKLKEGDRSKQKSHCYPEETLLSKLDERLTFISSSLERAREQAREQARIESLTFEDAVKEYGEHGYGLWEQQSHFDQMAMRFLLLHPEHTERLASKRGHIDCALELGLCAASSQVCSLRVEEVPCMAEWEISEYDGNESINVV